MKKLLFLFAVLLTSVGAWAQKPVISPKPTADGKWAEGTKWYTIKRNNTNYVSLSNADSNGFLKLDGTEQHGLAGLWCVVGSDANGYSFYNFKAGTSYVLGAYGSEANGRMRMYNLDVTADGTNALTKTFDIATLDGQTGYAFVKNHGSTNDWWNERNSYLAYWNSSYAYAANCTGSQFTFTEVAEDEIISMLDEYKGKAETALDMVSFLGVEDAKNNIDAIEHNINAFAAIDAEVNKVAQYVTFRNGDTDENSVRYNAYLSACMPKSKGHGTKPYYWKDATWSLRYSGNASFYIYNINNNVYLGSPSSNGVLTVAPQSAYTFESVEGYKVKLKCANETLHLNNTNGNAKVSIGWYLSNHDNNDVASHWYIENNFASLLESYKQSVLSALNVWGELSGVFETELVNSAKTAINSIVTADDYTIFASIDAELESVKNNVAEKYLTFKNSDTKTSARTDAYLAANMSTSKGFGTKTFDFNAIWSVQSAGGTYFYLYNELNNAYLQNPSSGSLVANKTQATRYAFQLVPAETCKVGFIADNETLHLGEDCALMSWGISDPASQWYIATYDYLDALQLLIEENENNHAETPLLGQYPSSTYNAMVSALESEPKPTLTETYNLITRFKASFNIPVYFITSAYEGGYPDGSAILYNGSSWRWATANIYDKRMWMTIPGYTQSNVPEVEAYAADGTNYEICDYLTGTVMRDKKVQIVKIPDWDGAYNLQYNADSNSEDAAQHAKDNGELVNWKPATKTECQASAWHMKYIGSSYELGQLTDEYLNEGNALCTLLSTYESGCEIANGVNNYHETAPGAYAAAKSKIAEVLGKLSTPEEIADAKAQLEASLAINLPKDGGFYRLRCTGNGMKYLQCTQNTNAERFDMINGGKTVNATFCYTNGGLVAYANPMYINHDDNVASYKMSKTDVIFSEATNVKGQYFIKVGARYLYGDGNTSDSGTGTNSNAGYRWWLESVTSLPFTFNADARGYATFNAPVAVQLPDGVNAYIGEIVEGNKLQMRKFEEGKIPANTAVLLYNSDYANTPEVSLSIIETTGYTQDVLYDIDDKDDFVGTVAAENLNAEKNCYSLQKGTTGESAGMMGFFKKNSGTKAGFKAWLEITKSTSNARAFTIIFDGDDATGLKEALGLENENVEIYDLSGRRLDKLAKGVNVIGGKLVIK